MHLLRYVVACTLFLFAALSADSLPSWNEGPNKKAIIDFVNAVIDKESHDYIAPEERFATFDQDGTLWVEQPLPTPLVYCLERLKVLAKDKPEWKDEEPFKTVLSGDPGTLAKLAWPDLEKVIAAALTGMPVEQFQSEAKSWLATAKHPRWDRPFTDLTYAPMQEVLKYLQDNGFKTYIVTGGGQDFVRVYSEKIYGIPQQQVIGSAWSVQYGYDKDGKPTLTKEPKILLHNDRAGKPVGINLMIGQRPNAAFGNSLGDKEMLEYTKAAPGISLCMIVLHDDEKREYAYGPAQGLPDSKVGTFTQALYDQAVKSGWIVISMKNDWSRIFAFDPIK